MATKLNAGDRDGVDSKHIEFKDGQAKRGKRGDALAKATRPPQKE